MKTFDEITAKMQTIYEAKNKLYGNSFDKSLDDDGLLVSKIRLGDKYNRFAKLVKTKSNGTADESIEDTLLDMANYAVMTLMWMSKDKQEDEPLETIANSFEDKVNNAVNLYKQSGSLDGFDWHGGFFDGYARVKVNDKLNLIKKNGELVSSQWFDYCGYVYEGFSYVKLDGKWNFIDTNGKLLSTLLFDGVGHFWEGFALVHNEDGVYNYIDKNGKLLSDKWFDGGGPFDDGFARVELNGTSMYIDNQGRLYDINKQPIDNPN